MAELIYLVGLPGSGKSTYANKLKEKGYKVFSSDSIRKELYGDESIQGDGNKVFNILHKRISENLKNNVNCIYDSTGISSKRRMSFLNSISNIKCTKICILFATPYEICLERNSKRDRKVPEDVIRRMYTNFNIPYYYEGWNDIRIVWGVDEVDKYNMLGYEFSNICNKWKNYNQNNSHHSLTLGEHLRKAFKIAKDKDFSLNTQFASSLHDCGKPFVASFTDSKGNPSKDCHYYKHENVSAYISLFMLINNVLFRKNDILYICTLINLHMKPYTWKEEKTKEKYKNLLGERMYKDLMDLHYCDVNAH